jgi:hypothetical protein
MTRRTPVPADSSSPIPAALTHLARTDPVQLQDADAPHLLAYRTMPPARCWPNARSAAHPKRSPPSPHCWPSLTSPGPWSRPTRCRPTLRPPSSWSAPSTPTPCSVQGQPAHPAGALHRPALASRPGVGPHPRSRPRPRRGPHPQGGQRPPLRLSPCRPGPPGHPQEPCLACPAAVHDRDRLRGHQPRLRAGQPGPPRRSAARALGHRGAAPHPRCHLRRGRLSGPQRSGPHAMAPCATWSSGRCAGAGPVNVAAALRRHARDPRRPLVTLGITLGNSYG